MPSLKELAVYVFKDRHENPVRYMLYKAKKNAKKSEISFDLDHKDISMPDKCPVLGIQLRIGNGKTEYNSPSLDRYNSNLGYTKDNVSIISWRANHLKNNGTLDEFRSLVKWMEEREKDSAALA